MIGGYEAIYTRLLGKVTGIAIDFQKQAIVAWYERRHAIKVLLVVRHFAAGR
jgi:hypothetical protein